MTVFSVYKINFAIFLFTAARVRTIKPTGDLSSTRKTTAIKAH